MHKKILITGGAGFIGSHLARALLLRGDEVICVDNFFTGSKDNVLDLLSNLRFELIRHDITSPFYIERIDEIYNLACPAAPTHYQHNPIHTTKTSVLGAINMLGLAKRLNIPVLQASTSEVYGDPDEHPQSESYWGRVNPIGLRACYDEGKRCAETLFFDYHREHDLHVRVVRIFNTYGPRMALNDGRVVSSFIIQALRNEAITIYGDGSQTRSFQYVDDLVRGMVLMMENEHGFTGPVNLGNPTEVTVRELAELIIAMVGSKSKIILRPLPEDDPKRRRPDINLAQEKLGWAPTVSLPEGLAKTVDYFRTVV